jgi:hypothetical protein
LDVAVSLSLETASAKCLVVRRILQLANPLNISTQFHPGAFDFPWEYSYSHNLYINRVSTLVLGPPKAKYRAQVYEKFCSVITHLIRLRNYSTCWAVTSGLNDLSIRRLGTTLSLVRASAKRELQDAMRLIDPTGSYKVYREFLKRDCDLGSKAIPFL